MTEGGNEGMKERAMNEERKEETNERMKERTNKGADKRRKE